MSRKETVTEMIAEISRLRETVRLDRANLGLQREAFEQTIAPLKSKISSDELALEALEKAVKAECVSEFIETGEKHLHPALGIRAKRGCKYDYNTAFAWAKENAEEFIALDTKLFEKYALEQKSKPLPFVEITTEYTATLAANIEKENE